jgi:hypothetical protein
LIADGSCWFHLALSSRPAGDRSEIHSAPSPRPH